MQAAEQQMTEKLHVILQKWMGLYPGLLTDVSQLPMIVAELTPVKRCMMLLAAVVFIARRNGQPTVCRAHLIYIFDNLLNISSLSA